MHWLASGEWEHQDDSLLLEHYQRVRRSFKCDGGLSCIVQAAAIEKTWLFCDEQLYKARLLLSLAIQYRMRFDEALTVTTTSHSRPSVMKHATWVRAWYGINASAVLHFSFANAEYRRLVQKKKLCLIANVHSCWPLAVIPLSICPARSIDVNGE